MRITLTVEEGPHVGQKFVFEGHDLFLVGRSKKTHFQLRDKDMYFSRIHFMIEVNPPLCRISDMGSRNGTFVNGEKVKTALVKDGDLVKAGHTILRVNMSTSDEPVSFADLESPATGTFIAPVGDQSGQTLAVSAGPGAPTTPPTVAPAVAEDAAPFQVPGYKLVKELGRGGMGIVFLGESEVDRAPVAIKTIMPNGQSDSRETKRFLREVDILRQLDHPGIVKFLEAGECGGALYFVMEFVPGTDLQRVIAEQKSLKIKTAVRMICQVLEALGHAHAKGFVHRDMKPANVLLQSLPGGKRQVKLADFGLGRIYQASQISGLTLQGELGGTPHFMPPEQVTSYRDVSPAADQYSTAAMLYYLITGQFPLDLPPLPGALIAILEEEPIPIRQRNPEVPKQLAEVIHTALIKDPAKRYADVNEFRRELLKFGS